MTYRISSFLLGLAFLAGGFAAPVQAADAQVYRVSIKAGEPAPTCKARASKMRIYAGDATTLVWESRHADRMYGIVKDGEWHRHGRQRVALSKPGMNTFQMIFVGEGGFTTCEAKVFVKPVKATD